ncbi:LLM class flavin-dependent oxidoreductase [Actinophytocola oryzae]|uniref:Alkanesulfonate monooxygenase SsuD/methylene tetrahydromethanopterin reductase-like flavin-dependent oxidoreductase (Luciferase family) n=1 Tax=Actinophytocola oryzae TaxID=502181 RepID=A0A4R7W100_9PSEU|nr:LLM class flavin-dependent oxidoreductase [Actinophytocola oryzae]TDV56210.1 alkanesulfonate monooxygenase SsuD/methylene tetrahydromethanopterin reductase-like flavin-dependent oxidoreductase (luciferase family) [Actinophytocola oryzae]
MALHVGMGLWNMRSTAAHPAPHPELYATLVSDARAAEEAGFDSIWLGEHRYWYDGWCPQPVLAAAAVLGATQRISVGTAVHLLPQHDLGPAVGLVRRIQALWPGRLRLGVGLGYRAGEYAVTGLDITDRVRRLVDGLDALVAEGLGELVLVGGMRPATMARAARRGLGVLLPPTTTLARTVDLVGRLRTAAPEVPVGLMRDVWLGSPEWYEEVLRPHYTEYVTAWWAPNDEAVPGQVERNLVTAIAGTADELTEALRPFLAAGVDTLVLQAHIEPTRTRRAEQIATLGESLLPRLRSLSRSAA